MFGWLRVRRCADPEFSQTRVGTGRFSVVGTRRKGDELALLSRRSPNVATNARAHAERVGGTHE